MFQRGAPTIGIGRATVELPPGVFLQATVDGGETLARLVLFRTLRESKTAIDLFCGVGPFALRMAEFARVVAADSDEAAITALTKAAPAPGLKPVAAQARIFPKTLNRAGTQGRRTGLRSSASGCGSTGTGNSEEQGACRCRRVV